MSACKTIHGPESDERRLLDRLPIGDGCWEWTGAVDPATGYGRMSIGNRRLGVHRIAYEMLVGPIPDGLVLDHLCRNRKCARPSHLEPVTSAENIRRGVGAERAKERAAAATHCREGHPWDEDNTRIRPNGKRRCRTCERAARRERTIRDREG